MLLLADWEDRGAPSTLHSCSHPAGRGGAQPKCPVHQRSEMECLVHAAETVRLAAVKAWNR